MPRTLLLLAMMYFLRCTLSFRHSSARSFSRSLSASANRFGAKGSAAKRTDRHVAERASKAKGPQLEEEEDDGSYPHLGLVMQRLGDRLTVEHISTDLTDPSDPVAPLPPKALFTCMQRAHLSSISVVAGDRVRYNVVNAAEALGMVNEVIARRNLLERPGLPMGDLKKKTVFKAICSNVDQIIVVLAAQPTVPLPTVDRYLITAAVAAIPKVIVLVNKADLPQSPGLIAEVRDYYRGVGVDVITSCALSGRDGEGMRELLGVLRGRTSILAGQSGVGKSSLINCLLGTDEKVGPLKRDSKHGSHTTSNTKLHHLGGEGEGDLLDSPGVREMFVWHYSPQQILLGYEEIAEAAKGCRFRDCQHMGVKPALCGVQRALKAGAIHAGRFQSYCDLLANR